ncbi:hypothetical protein HA520_11315 [Azotobacter chroococcum]|uniref:Uncharacterized protein n=1 Tax=Azotobacter chroococcum TaxID=353 RepID=A0AA43Z6K9_9GAMM|nr:hypothetical protein [Azotobacter chroococcum]NHN77863.1 hypothetical protein [Azotobacter chroococcum]
MVTVDTAWTQQALDSLRVVRRKLYAIPESELGAMSLDDQVKYGDSLHQTGLAILKLEAAKLKGVNDQFKEKEEGLKDAAVRLESDASALADAVKIIRVISDGIKLVTNIVTLLR